MAVVICHNPHAGENYDPNRSNNTPEAWAEHVALAHETLFEGRVLADREINGYDDSDFYVLYWDDEKQKISEYTYATTRGWTLHNSASIDATEENLAKARAWQADRWEERLTHAEMANRIKHAEGVRKGVRVRSTTTRGKNVGVEGTVVWIGDDSYSSSPHAKRYGVKVEGEDKLRYLSDVRCERTDKDPIKPLTDAEKAEIRAEAEYKAGMK